MKINKVFIEKFREKIIKWGQKHFVAYPWRLTRDPYKLLIAEVLLHRTRSEQVVLLYLNFIKKYPNIHALVATDISELEKILFSAGLRWRIKKLYEMAKEIVNKYGGKIPEDYDELRSLPGVSDYIASAVRCFAFNYPDPIIDTNTVRIIGRVLGLTISDSLRRKKSFKQLVKQLVDPKNPASFNFALLDLGKIVCKARNPLCYKCPIYSLCCYAKKINQ